jgi:hypothetical protein
VKTCEIGQAWWLTHIIPATWEAEIKRTEVQARLREKHNTLYDK